MICHDDRRREEVRQADLNGLDYVEVSNDGRVLDVYLLGKLTGDVSASNIRIDGGVRIKNIVVTHVEPVRTQDQKSDDVLRVFSNMRGDSSTYTLHVVEADEYNRPGTEPLKGFDARYATVDFTFYGAAPTSSVYPPSQAAPVSRDEPEINYLAKDYASFRQLILDRLAIVAPAWQERHVPDLGLTLVEVLAYIGDQLSYYQDAVATEAYLNTARQRISVRRHLRLIDYSLHDGCNARAWVCIETAGDMTLEPTDVYFVSDTNQTMTSRDTVMPGRDMGEVPSSQYEVFEPIEDRPINLYAAHNRISFYTWDNRGCVLPEGATSATLRDDEQGGERALSRLRAGDVLIFEEVLGPRTGVAADADPRHRRAVRLTKVTPGCDELHAQPVVHIEWDREDALPFPLVISAIGQAPDCNYIEDITIARGNVVLVDHGRTVTEKEPWMVAPQEEPTECEGEGQPADRVLQAAPFYPVLTQGPVTQRVPYPERRMIARRQAQVLDQIIRDIRLQVVEIWRAVEKREETNPAARLSDDEYETLSTIFGKEVLARFEIREDQRATQNPSKALKRLLLLEGRLLLPATSRGVVFSQRSLFARKIRRLTSLRERAYSGYCLTDRDAQEVGTLFGQEYGERLKPTNPLLYGSVQQAIRQDVAEALPCLTVKEEQEGKEQEERKQDGTRQDGKEWGPRRDLLNSGRENRHVVAEVDDGGIAHLRFGNGDLGRPVQPGVALRATYRVGNGTKGNVVAEAISHLVYRSTSVSDSRVLRVRNPLPAQGGSDPEPIATAKLKAPASLRSQLERAVVAEDYARFAERNEKVQRAAAELRWAHGWYEVRVFIDPLHGFVLEDGLRDELARDLYAYRRIGHQVVVLPARYVPLDIALTVTIRQHQLRDHVAEELRAVLGNATLPDGRKGLFHPDLLTFGDSLYLSRLVATAQAVPGVLSVEVTRLCRLFHPPAKEIEDGMLRIGPFEIARLDNDPNRPELGKLALTITGGR
ncbi:MAG: putative baseplate assembly protein [Nitrospira sp.]|nr:putative baseplate assembly protein [Nitrospira sp.]